MSERKQTNWDTHRWDNANYHGSVHWVYTLCKVSEREPGAHEKCPKIDEVLAKEKQREEEAERREYQQMLNVKARFKYLHAKYGGQC